MLKELRKMDPRDAQRWYDNTTRMLASAARRKGLVVGRGGTVGIDVTNMSYCGGTLKEEMPNTKPKDGTSRFLSFMAAHPVGGRSRRLCGGRSDHKRGQGAWCRI